MKKCKTPKTHQRKRHQKRRRAIRQSQECTCKTPEEVVLNEYLDEVTKGWIDFNSGYYEKLYEAAEQSRKRRAEANLEAYDAG